MKKQKLKTYDIKTYDIELKYNKLIAPILEKIEKLSNINETKSLKAHKDFLSNEQKSKEKLNELHNKSFEKEAKIKIVTSNKVTKLNVKERSIKTAFIKLKESELEKVTAQIAAINLSKDEFKKLEEIDVLEIKKKYRFNVETYVEKLDAYNLNFDKNYDFFLSKKLDYHTEISNHLKEIEEIQIQFEAKIKQHLNDNINSLNFKKEENIVILDDTDKEVTQILNVIKHDTNTKIREIKIEINESQKKYTEMNDKYIEELNNEIFSLNETHVKRLEVIDIDTNINLTKLNEQLVIALEQKAKSSIKDIKMKLNLINIRKETIVQTETNILEYRLTTLNNQIEKIKEDSFLETKNTDKLQIFLVNDQLEIKDTGNYLRNLNLKLKNDLLTSTVENKEYTIKHDELKQNYIFAIKQVFDAFKKELLSYNNSLLKDLFEMYREIDEINKFLDTSEPLREIEVNNLKESIEISEIRERNNIKFAVSDHDITVLNKNLDKFNDTEEIKTLTKFSENNLLITDIKNKEILDIAIEKALVKYNKAKEVYKLRSNNTMLERALLSNNLDSTISLINLEKDISLLENEKSVHLENLEIKSQIENIKTESDYKIEVVERRLEEELLKLDEKITANNYDREAIINKLDVEIEKESRIKNDSIFNIKLQYTEKLSLIEKALEHEILEPNQNILKANAVIDERFKKLDQNNDSLETLIYSMLQEILNDDITIEEIIDFYLKDDKLSQFTIKYVSSLYESYKNASSFMSDLRDINISNKITSTTDKSKIKKMKKQLQKQKVETEKIKKQINLEEKAALASTATFLVAQKTKLNALVEPEVENVKMFVSNLFQEIEKSLSNQYKILVNDIRQIYLPLTKLDIEKIDHANNSKDKAVSIVVAEQDELVHPIEDELTEFVAVRESKRTETVEVYKENISNLKKQVKELKDLALVDVRAINSEKKELISTFDIRLEGLKNVINDRNDKSLTDYNTQKQDITATYDSRLAKLNENDSEAHKIFNYEERIYNIANETANARYIDSFQKISNLHSLNEKEHQKKISKIIQETKVFLTLEKSKLLKQTTIYENNIFTVRPRLEESIGDAHKSIEKDIIDKIVRRNSLLERVDQTLEQLHNNKYLSYHNLFERIDTVLQDNMEVYNKIYNDYSNANDSFNSEISEAVSKYRKSLFELSKSKHQTTVTDLMKVNKKILT